MSEGKTMMSEYLNQRQLAEALVMSLPTLYRMISANNKKAKENHLKRVPCHRMYSGGRKYYIKEEFISWVEQLNSIG